MERELLETFVQEEIEYEIFERLPENELRVKLYTLNKKYSGKLIEHIKSDKWYRISHLSILNHDGVAEYAVNYHPYHEDTGTDASDIKYTRPAREFFDGRFI